MRGTKCPGVLYIHSQYCQSNNVLHFGKLPSHRQLYNRVLVRFLLGKLKVPAAGRRTIGRLFRPPQNSERRGNNQDENSNPS